MLAYLVLGVSLLAAVLLGARWFVTADPRRLAKIVRFAGLGLLIAVALFLFVTGRFAIGLLPAAIAFAVWRAMRGGGMSFPSGGGGAWRGAGGGSSSGRASNVETEFLRMTLQHDSGDMDGEVLKGRFAGTRLGDLSLESLLELLAECQVDDPQSVALLETYLDRLHGAEWRGRAEQASEQRSARPNGGGMSVEEARDILGVGADASADEIRAAHHQQMMKHHPDRGGSSYLAARINEAKDILLQS